ncbi:hypothetical protein Xedl_03854 [Xenorhabdus eapokensis]|uniref:Uncharacterized protein n=1 Tax=Xenorhabdus eapokensis TaxID=1873482 RepID=A0A1Q5TDX1_9GAMM|nr:hypothetical protein Xedl_03854 [Xenorhabdus eapokensis]
MVEQDALLQRRQRIDILHILGAAWDLLNDDIDFGLGERNQRQHIGGDGRATCGDQVRRHNKGAGLMLDCLSHIGQNRGGEDIANIELPAQMAQLFDQTDNHQRMAAKLKEMVMATDLFQT